MNGAWTSDDNVVHGYMATPESGAGPMVLVLHAWWGLTDFFEELCDRLAQEGFVAVAPDIFDGPTTSIIEEAQQLVDQVDGKQAVQRIQAAARYALNVSSTKRIGMIGFSFGAAYGILLTEAMPDEIAALTLFYGAYTADFSVARAAYQGHFAEVDEYEPLEGAQEMEADMRAAGREVEFHIYPGTGHWFFESNRPDAYNAEAAHLAWERTLDFMRRHLGE